MVYSPDDELVISRGFCLGPATNNVAEYHATIVLLIKSSSLGISHMVVRLDSQLVVSYLNRVYIVRNPILLQLYLCACFLERYFYYIRYEHIPRELKMMSDSLANYILNWHLAHI